MSWPARLVALAFLVALFVGLAFALREIGGDLRVVETVTTTADGQTTTVREGGHHFPGYLFAPFAFFGAIFFWFLAFGLLKTALFGFWRGGHGGPGGDGGGWRARRDERWEARAREIHDRWHGEYGEREHPGGGGGERSSASAG